LRGGAADRRVFLLQFSAGRTRRQRTARSTEVNFRHPLHYCDAILSLCCSSSLFELKLNPLWPCAGLLVKKKLTISCPTVAQIDDFLLVDWKLSSQCVFFTRFSPDDFLLVDWELSSQCVSFTRFSPDEQGCSFPSILHLKPQPNFSFRLPFSLRFLPVLAILNRLIASALCFRLGTKQSISASSYIEPFQPACLHLRATHDPFILLAQICNSASQLAMDSTVLGLKLVVLALSMVIWVSGTCNAADFTPADNYLINCGSTVDATVDNRVFVADTSGPAILTTPTTQSIAASLGVRQRYAVSDC
jgi:hypothetical protein